MAIQPPSLLTSLPSVPIASLQSYFPAYRLTCLQDRRHDNKPYRLLASKLSYHPAFLPSGRHSGSPAICQAYLTAFFHAGRPFCHHASLLHIFLASLPATVYCSAHDYRGGKFQRRCRQIEWIKESTPGVRTVRLANPDEILDQLPLLEPEADYIIADGPGSNTETSRALLLRADMALVPCKASMLEVRALAQATGVLRQAQDIRGGQPKAKIVLSMVGKNYRLTHDMKDAAASLKLPLAKTAVTLKQIYADAPGQGAVVWGMGARGREAAQEIKALFREILPDAISGKSSRRTKQAAA